MKKNLWIFISGILLLVVVLLVGILIGNNSNNSSTNIDKAVISKNIDTSQLKECKSLGEIIRTEPFGIQYCLKINDSKNYYLSSNITEMPEFAVYMYCTFNALYHSMDVSAEQEDSDGNVDTLFGKINSLGYRKSFGPYSIFFGDSNLKPEIRQVFTEKELLAGYISKYPEDNFLMSNLVEFEIIESEQSAIFRDLLNPDSKNKDELRKQLLQIDERWNKASSTIVNNCVTASEKLRYRFSFPSQNTLLSNLGNLFYDDFESLLS